MKLCEMPPCKDIKLYEEKEDDQSEEEDLTEPGANDYNYLLGLKIWTLT